MTTEVKDPRLLSEKRLAAIRQWDVDARPLLDHIDALTEERQRKSVSDRENDHTAARPRRLQHDKTLPRHSRPRRV